ncbi:fibroblast growth factor 5 [Chelydra serpentina]|uniref:Fibroblast growth factor 5 n=1 Tax=Chelydra serpentina TaxID=8475 RepID=A0A8T1SU24_CHESE|nr:fibroblast growth factor 5 [Chelydra serpentina]
MSVSFRCLLFLSHLILGSALAQEAQLPPGAQLRSAASSAGGNTSPASSPSSPSSGAAGSGPERSSFQWSPSGRRTGSLYCRVGIGFHLQIHPDGKVNGSHEASLLSKFWSLPWGGPSVPRGNRERRARGARKPFPDPGSWVDSLPAAGAGSRAWFGLAGSRGHVLPLWPPNDQLTPSPATGGSKCKQATLSSSPSWGGWGAFFSVLV